MGRVFFGGGKPAMEAPSGGILASDLAVGSTVKLMENGSPAEYLVVNQGKPSESTLYDDSCDGMWLLRKDIYVNRSWTGSGVNNYGASTTVNSYLNSDVLSLFGEVEQAVIKQAKIPYVNGAGNSGAVASGSNGLSVKLFLLSCYEAGWTQADRYYFPIDGACLAYFYGAAQTDSKRIGYLGGVATNWWLRSPWTANDYIVNSVDVNGYCCGDYANKNYGIRPALILPSNALFDEETMLLKGVA